MQIRQLLDINKFKRKDLIFNNMVRPFDPFLHKYLNGKKMYFETDTRSYKFERLFMGYKVFLSVLKIRHKIPLFF